MAKNALNDLSPLNGAAARQCGYRWMHIIAAPLRGKLRRGYKVPELEVARHASDTTPGVSCCYQVWPFRTPRAGAGDHSLRRRRRKQTGWRGRSPVRQRGAALWRVPRWHQPQGQGIGMNYGIRALTERDLHVALGKAVAVRAWMTMEAINREMGRRAVAYAIAHNLIVHPSHIASMERLGADASGVQSTRLML